MNFTNESKERWATNFKVLLQQIRILIGRRREAVSQIHSIRRSVTPSGRVAYDAERTAAGHADKFWSMALACRQETDEDSQDHEVGVTVFQ
jgi:phage FluMu gp28-like protein